MQSGIISDAIVSVNSRLMQLYSSLCSPHIVLLTTALVRVRAHGRVGLKMRCGQMQCWCIAALYTNNNLHSTIQCKESTTYRRVHNTHTLRSLHTHTDGLLLCKRREMTLTVKRSLWVPGKSNVLIRIHWGTPEFWRDSAMTLWLVYWTLCPKHTHD